MLMLPYQEDFFFILHNILAEMEEVTELQPVLDAHVPVMKFKFDGLSIDLLYASISRLVVREVSMNYTVCSFFFIFIFYFFNMKLKSVLMVKIKIESALVVR